ncbi:MAG: hypothetical protein ACR2OB_03715 [Solirubrobacteraceae bacterium]
MSLRRLRILACSLVLTFAVAACGNREAHPTVADNEGFYVDAGPITYQVQLSRQLNPYSVEDKGYLNGVTTAPPKPDEFWFAIFVWAKNQTHSAQMTTNGFDIIDTQGNKYYPVPLNAQLDPYAWTPQLLAPLGTEPAPDSTAIFGPTQGSELLFKINATAYDNRPLTLEIHAPGQANPSSVSLDL